MAQKIWKYPIEIILGRQTVLMPRNAIILCVQAQGNEPQLWALVDTEAPEAARKLLLFGTGHPITEPLGSYVGTFQIQAYGGAYVWHVFEAVA